MTLTESSSRSPVHMHRVGQRKAFTGTNRFSQRKGTAFNFIPTGEGGIHRIGDTHKA